MLKTQWHSEASTPWPLTPSVRQRPALSLKPAHKYDLLKSAFEIRHLCHIQIASFLKISLVSKFRG